MADTTADVPTTVLTWGEGDNTVRVRVASDAVANLLGTGGGSFHLAEGESDPRPADREAGPYDELLAGNVESVLDALADMDPDEVEAVQTAEAAGRGRKGIAEYRP